MYKDLGSSEDVPMKFIDSNQDKNKNQNDRQRNTTI